jgi:hypothetical protein
MAQGKKLDRLDLVENLVNLDLVENLDRLDLVENLVNLEFKVLRVHPDLLDLTQSCLFQSVDVRLQRLTILGLKRTK